MLSNIKLSMFHKYIKTNILNTFHKKDIKKESNIYHKYTMISMSNTFHKRDTKKESNIKQLRDKLYIHLHKNNNYNPLKTQLNQFLLILLRRMFNMSHKHNMSHKQSNMFNNLHKQSNMFNNLRQKMLHMFNNNLYNNLNNSQYNTKQFNNHNMFNMFRDL